MSFGSSIGSEEWATPKKEDLIGFFFLAWNSCVGPMAVMVYGGLCASMYQLCSGTQRCSRHYCQDFCRRLFVGAFMAGHTGVGFLIPFIVGLLAFCIAVVPYIYIFTYIVVRTYLNSEPVPEEEASVNHPSENEITTNDLENPIGINPQWIRLEESLQGHNEAEAEDTSITAVHTITAADGVEGQSIQGQEQQSDDGVALLSAEQLQFWKTKFNATAAGDRE